MHQRTHVEIDTELDQLETRVVALERESRAEIRVRVTAEIGARLSALEATVASLTAELAELRASSTTPA